MEMSAKHFRTIMYNYMHKKTLPAGGILVLLGYFTIFLVCGRGLYACSTPVFVYARERWEPDKYHIEIAYDTALNPALQNTVEMLATPATKEKEAANLEVHELKRPNVSVKPQNDTPMLRVYYPGEIGSKEPFWTSHCDNDSIKKILDSPLRRKIVSELTGGTSGVWVFIESGQREKDEELFELLKKQLTEFTKNPKPMEESDQKAAAGEITISFSILSVSRNDLEEFFLIKNLIGTEADLKDIKEPMVFPIFGRGRVLYALIGDGINPSMIRRACEYITGVCNCEVKKDSPGVDLLLKADWSRFNTTNVTEDAIPLIGLGSAGFVSPDKSIEGKKRLSETTTSAGNISIPIAVVLSVVAVLFFVIIATTLLWIKMAKKSSRLAGQ
jgi:hypothetical protein